MERLGCALFMYACTCDALRDLVAFVHLYNLENVKNTHGGVLLLVKLQAFSVPKSNIPPKVTFLHGCFSRFLNCTNGTKSHKTSHI